MLQVDIELERKALREYGLLGRGANMGNSLFALAYNSLPNEAKDVLFKIANGLPLQYIRDGKPFGNHFGDLPKGEYFEYTVVTPGAKKRSDGKPHRGKRRIVARRNGMVFFTACHYERYSVGKSQEQKEKQISRTFQIDPEWRNGFYIITGIEPNLRDKIAQRMRSK